MNKNKSINLRAIKMRKTLLLKLLSNPNHTPCESDIFLIEEYIKYLFGNNDLLIMKLQHHKDATVGLWAIDQDPKQVSYDWIKENSFQII